MTGVDRRLLQRIALIMTAGWVFQKAVKIDFHLDDIRVLLLNVFREARADQALTDPADELLSMIKGELVLNQGKFPSKDSCNRLTAGWHVDDPWGIVENVNGRVYVWIIERIFHAIIGRQKRCGIRTACKKLEQKGYLVRFYGDRYLTDQKVGAFEGACYCITFAAPSKTGNGTIHSATPSKTGMNKQRKGSKIAELMADNEDC